MSSPSSPLGPILNDSTRPSVGLFIWVILVVAAAMGVGWIFGASGKSSVDQERRALEERADLADARALVLDGRVSLYLANFSDASRQFESARAIVERLQIRLRETGLPDRAGRLEIVLAQLREADRLSTALDGRAQQVAEQASQALGPLR